MINFIKETTKPTDFTEIVTSPYFYEKIAKPLEIFESP